MLFMKGTDIHWGDPVNTSSKLGQDIAKNGDILIMPSVYEPLKKDDIFKELTFKEKSFVKSKVELKCYKVIS